MVEGCFTHFVPFSAAFFPVGLFDAEKIVCGVNVEVGAVVSVAAEADAGAVGRGFIIGFDEGESCSVVLGGP